MKPDKLNKGLRLFRASFVLTSVCLYAMSAYSVYDMYAGTKPVEHRIVLSESQRSLSVAEAPKTVAVALPMATPTASNKMSVAQEFNFPSKVSDSARIYLEEVYAQTYEASKDTKYPDPFIAMSLAVVENPVDQDEVFRLPLVYQDVLDKELKKGVQGYKTVVSRSGTSRSFGKYACVGPLQMAVGWVASEHRDPTIWKEACAMFYEDVDIALPSMTTFAEKCGVEPTPEVLLTLAVMRHNVGNLSDWSSSSPSSSPNRSYIPFKTKRAVYEWNEAVASPKAQSAIKKAAYSAYKNYLETGNYDNQGIGWREIAEITGYPQSNVTSSKEWWRPLYSVRFWYNYYQLKLLYGVETGETLGVK